MDSIPCPISAHPDPDAPFLYTSDTVFTYRSCEERIQQLSRYICPSEKPVAFSATQSFDTLALFFAIWRRGRAALPLSSRLPSSAIEQIVAYTGADWFQMDSSPLPAASPFCFPQKTATLLLTSGTTSTPKIACHTLENHLYSAYHLHQALCLEREDRYLLNLPLNHVGGLATLLRTVCAGASLVFPPLLSLATHFSLVPTQLHRLLRTRLFSPSIKCVLIGGAALPPALRQEALKRSLPLYISYAMTETSSLIVLEDALKQTCWQLPGSEISIRSNEICVRGPMLFQGYWRGTEIELPLNEGWFETRDLGRRTPSGNLEWVGRKDRQFDSGGENIQPEEIESMLLTLPGILEARVTPEPDESFGNLIKAALLFDKEISFQSIEKELRLRLPGYKIPRKWESLSQPLKGL